MTIAATLLTSSFATNNNTTYTTASITPTANRLVLAIVTGGVNAAAPSLSGNGLTWVNIGTLANGTSRRTAIYRTMGASPSTEAVTITYGATSSNCTWVFVEFSDVDTSGTNGSGAVVQDDYAGGGSTPDTSGTVTLTNALGSADNMIVALFAIGGTSSGITEDADFTQVSEVTNTESGRASVATAFNQTTFTHTFSSAIWAGGIVEVRAAASGRTTKNTDPRPLGLRAGMSRRMHQSKSGLWMPDAEIIVPRLGIAA